MPSKIISPAAVMASPLLQVVPKTVEFSDVENDNELSAVVTVIVSLVNRSTAFLPEKVTSTPGFDATCVLSLQNLDTRKRLLRWKPPKSTVFRVHGLATTSNLAPGLRLSFKVGCFPALQARYTPLHLLTWQCC